jgi:FkbM family methyltransferase
VSALSEARNVLRYVWAHPANADRRCRSVARAVAFQVRGRLGLPTLTTVGEQALMRVELHATAASKMVYANPPDWNEMWAWRRILAPGDLFVDVGSNVGGYALWAADAGATVIAVEPGVRAVERLRANLRLNNLPITVRHCALAHLPGRMRLTQNADATNHLLLGSAADRDAARDEAEVDVDTLDNLLGERYAAGVKIDVEGAERLVLEGGRRALSEHRIGALQIEWNAASERLLGETRIPVADILREYGYTVMRPDAQGVLHEIAIPQICDEDLFAVAPAGAGSASKAQGTWSSARRSATGMQPS